MSQPAQPSPGWYESGTICDPTKKWPHDMPCDVRRPAQPLSAPVSSSNCSTRLSSKLSRSEAEFNLSLKRRRDLSECSVSLGAELSSIFFFIPPAVKSSSLPCLPRIARAFGPQPISHSRLGHNVARHHGIRLQLAAQVAHGDAQKVHRVLILGPTPEFVNQFMMRPNVVGLMDQHLQEIIF